MSSSATRLVVAVDGSPAAEAAVAKALDLATALRATVIFVHANSAIATDLFELHREEFPPLEEVLERDQVLARAHGQAVARGIEAEVEVVAEEGGSAGLAATIAGIAEGRDAEMLVTGSRGRGAVAGVVLGSVSQHLIKYATTPILVVHAPEPESEHER